MGIFSNADKPGRNVLPTGISAEIRSTSQMIPGGGCLVAGADVQRIPGSRLSHSKSSWNGLNYGIKAQIVHPAPQFQVAESCQIR